MLVSRLHRFSLIALSAAYLSMLAVLAIGTAARWDGQAAILALPFVLLMWIGLPISVILALVGLRLNWKISALLLIAAAATSLLLRLLMT